MYLHFLNQIISGISNDKGLIHIKLIFGDVASCSEINTKNANTIPAIPIRPKKLASYHFDTLPFFRSRKVTKIADIKIIETKVLAGIPDSVGVSNFAWSRVVAFPASGRGVPSDDTMLLFAANFSKNNGANARSFIVASLSKPDPNAKSINI